MVKQVKTLDNVPSNHLISHSAYPLILASSSPRRRELLSTLHYPFTTMTADIDERVCEGELVSDYLVRMVKTKANKAMMSVACGLIITADTIGVADGVILTKPTDKAHAFAMWDKLSGGTHEIWTAVCASLIKDGQIISQKIIKVVTQVEFIKLSHHQKERYWQTGEPTDKAGAYAIQGEAMAWVRAIHGSYTNVVGLPLAETAELIDELLAKR